MTKKPLLLLLSSMALILGGCGDRDLHASSVTPSSSDSSSSSASSSSSSSSSTSEQEVAQTKTIAELDDLYPSDGTKSKERYRVRATVKTVTNSQYGEMYITDSTGEAYVYGTYSADGKTRYGELPADQRPVAGDEVLLEANIQLYNGTKKELVSAWIIEFKHNATTVDPSEYPVATIAETRAKESGSKVQLKNVQVLAISYANKLVPNGVMVGDGVSSIYVFSTDIAGQVEVGQTVTIAGERVSYVLEKEQSYAQKYGYIGATQIDNAILVEKSEEKTELNLAGAETKTVKEILNTPVSANVSSLIYKTNAYITKSVKEGSGGFTNYYLNDLDGTTGTYVYTQASGNDFKWMDEFVGKICTVYVTPLNAKSTAYGCNWRFLPISVKDEGFTFDKNDAGKFAIEYHAADLFETTYVVDPVLELPTTVSSTLLGFEGASLTYTSDNADIASFETAEGKTLFHMKENGTAKVTITASLAGYKSATREITITRKDASDANAVTVKAAQETAENGEVTVEGIIGPSLTVQEGFYLIDETGMIPVVCYDSDAWFSHIKLGQKVILRGTREIWKSGTYAYGTQCIADAKIVYNEYGNYDYPTASFAESTVTDLKAKNVETDMSETMKVYKLSASISKSSGSYPTYSVTDGKSSIQLYSSSEAQYSFLAPYVGKNVSVEFALCNWNSKKDFKGSVLSVTGEDGVKVINKLHFRF